MTGTVIKDVLPVTTLITLVKKNTAIKDREFGPGHATMIARPSRYNVGASGGSGEPPIVKQRAANLWRSESS
jgi:hypothetical protein